MRINAQAIAVTTLVMACSLAASAQDNTEELLTAPRVRRFLAIGPPGADGQTMICRDVLPVRLSLDPWGGCAEVAAKAPFAFVSSTRDQIQILRPDFNPLRELVVVAASTTADSSSASLPGYAEFATSADAMSQARSSSLRKQLIRVVPEDCAAPTGVSERTKCLDDLRSEIPEVASALERWSATKDGLEGVRTVRAELREIVKELENNIGGMEKVRADLFEHFAKDPADPADASALAMIAGTADNLVKKRSLEAKLKELDGTLKGYDDPSRWIGNSLLAHSITTNLDEVQIRKISLSEMQWSFGDEGLSRKTKEVSPVTLRARAARGLVPEVSAAVIHTRLARKVYSAVDKNGQTVVQQGKDEGVDIKPAGILNFVCRCFGDSQLYPMIQLGTTEVDNAPAVLLGGGLRLFGKTPLAISGGGVVAWIRDLNNLKPGDVVKSSLEVDADLKRRMQIRLYVALQYKF